MDSEGDVATGEEGVLEYINSVAAQQQPFFLIVSLINPHDVLEHPSKLEDAGYDESWLRGEIGLSGTVNESLDTKPSAQRQFRRIMALSGRLKTHEEKRNYLNFYGNLMKLMDSYLVSVLDALEARHLLDDTLVIRTSLPLTPGPDGRASTTPPTSCSERRRRPRTTSSSPTTTGRPGRAGRPT